MTQQLPEGTVTVLFTDVEGSTALRTSRGDETAHARLQTHGELVRGQLREHRGHEVKTMGDGFMAAFASARAAVDCAVGIQRLLDEDNRSHPTEHHIRVRAGLHTGEVVREDGDLFGEAVNAAARIMAKALGGQILVSDTVRSVLGHGRDTELLDRGRFRMKGFPERWRLYEVLWRSKDEPAAAVAPVLAERTPFVGREAERAELRRLMEQAVAGHGSIVLIRGEPGVGKTRLAQELILEARKHGMFDSTGRCYEMEGAPPYIPYIEMLQQSLRRGAVGFRTALGENAGEIAKILPELRQVFDDIPPPLELPPEQERLYLFNSMATLLESRVNNSYNISVLGQDTGPGIIFFGPKDSRQIRSMLQVNKELEASESRDGHGDGFWSNALAVYARDQGPRMTNLGNVQEIFSRPAPLNDGLLFAPRRLSFSCPHEFERLELADRLRIRPTQIKYRCRFCLGLVEKLPPGYEHAT